jgi:hypothetical protein
MIHLRAQHQSQRDEMVPAVIAAFDRKFSSPTLNSGALCDAVTYKVDNSRKAQRRHIQRANEANTRVEDESIAGRASIKELTTSITSAGLLYVASYLESAHSNR